MRPSKNWFEINIRMVSGSVSLLEVLQQLLDALRALQLGSDAIGVIERGIPLDWMILASTGWCRNWEPDLTKTFTENLDAFQEWVQSVLEEEKSLPEPCVALYIACPKPTL
ncbi:MAG: hypothetical protein LKKZDAJK_001627 [Candidatus Fervidibacter sp.]